MKQLLALLFLVCGVNAYAKESWPIRIGLSIVAESYSIQTKETNETNKANASFFSGQIVPSIGFFVNSKTLIGAQYSQSMMGDFGVSGIGAFGRYYFMGGSSRILELADLEVKLAPNYSVYAGLTYKNLLIGAGDFDVRFNGLEASIGGEKLLSENYFLQAALAFTQLSSSNSRNGASFGVSAGIGYLY